MTVLSRGGRNRRGGRRPGWLLLTTLLVLAIVASSALVFTNRVELLKLAVVLSLWAAVVGAFVSVIYRRQSDVDAARARDLKLVYDLQLDREISARREYELSVESHLRRELASELRAQSADEVAALRAELAALRANLEIWFDADLGDRRALEGDRAGGYGHWTRDTPTMPLAPGRVQSSRITPVTAEETASSNAENPIIDVPEEPLVASQTAVPAPAAPPRRPSPPLRRDREPQDADGYGGSHRRPSGNGARPALAPEPSFVPPPPPPRPESAPTSLPEPAPEPVGPEPVAEPARPEPTAEPAPAAPAAEWQPAQADGHVLPPDTPGSTRASAMADRADIRPPERAAGEPRRGRHWTGPEPEEATAPPPARPEPVMQPAPEPAPRARHSVEVPTYGQTAPAMSTPPPPAPTPRHRGSDTGGEPAEAPRGQHSGGQSVADLLARLQANGDAGGGGRRRRTE